MIDQYDRLLGFRRAALVKRWHTWPVLREQTLAAHSHGVAMLVWQVYPEASAGLLMAALVHDLAEVSTGDVPAHVKWANPEMTAMLEAMEQKWLEKQALDFKLSTVEQTILKFCDSFELLMFALEEFNMGNQNMREVIHNVVGRLRPIAGVTDVSRILFRDAYHVVYKIFGDSV
jgi:5'-deoxynucleotidase YfbR-like HD superfamily hydrolase